MISGIVTDRHAIIALTFLLPSGSTFPIEFVVDTGFTDYLCLPPEAVSLLRLPFLYDLSVNLADNSEVLLAVHEAIIIWNGEEREIRVLLQFSHKYGTPLNPDLLVCRAKRGTRAYCIHLKTAIATGRRPLLGTALLDEHELVVQFIEGGLVTIDEL